jgi:hypothetical protein
MNYVTSRSLKKFGLETGRLIGRNPIKIKNYHNYNRILDLGWYSFAYAMEPKYRHDPVAFFGFIPGNETHPATLVIPARMVILLFSAEPGSDQGGE